MPVTVHEVARAIPGIPALRARCQSLAMLDAVLSPEWAYRYYSFDSFWSPGEEMASMRNGSGDAYSIVFCSAGAFIRGFDHESPMTPYGVTPRRLWPGLIDDVPPAFAQHVAEPAFSMPDLGMLEATVCLWRQVHDSQWHTGGMEFPAGDDPDGSGWMFELLVNDSPAAYQQFAEEYYEVPVDLAAVDHIYAMRPLTEDVVRALNAEASSESLAKDVAEIGYPAAV